MSDDAGNDHPKDSVEDSPDPGKTPGDPRDTDHPAGKEHAQKNKEDEPVA